MNAYNTIATMLDEKEIDLDEYFTVTGEIWGDNLLTYRVVLDLIAQAPATEQDEILAVLRKLDFHHADVRPFLRHLAQAVAK